MSYKQAHILRGLVEEYIRTGTPVGSSHLVEKLGLYVSSATMRGILQGLEKKGYVQKPHTSAGRIPTDAGYRYYVDHLRFREPRDEQVRSLGDQLRVYREEYGQPSLATAKLLAELSNALAVTGWMASRDIHEVGLASLFDEGDEEQQQAIREVFVLLDNVDSYLDQFAESAHSNVDVYIGEENPVLDVSHMSVLVRGVTTNQDEEAVMLLVGPKRMPYRRNVSILNDLASIIEEVEL